MVEGKKSRKRFVGKYNVPLLFSRAEQRVTDIAVSAVMYHIELHIHGGPWDVRLSQKLVRNVLRI